MRHRKAFTLLEMMVVVAIIILLVGIAIAAYGKLVNSAASKSTSSALHLSQSILAEYDQAVGISNLGGKVIGPNQYNITDPNFPYPGGYNVNPALILPDARTAWQAAPIGVGTPVATGSVAVDSDSRFPLSPTDPTITTNFKQAYSYDSGIGFKYVTRSTAPNTNAIYNTAAVMMYMVRTPQVRQLVSAIPSKSLLNLTGRPIFFTSGNNKMEAPILLDGWGNPIIYVPAGGLVVNIKGTSVPILVRTSGIVPLTGAAPFLTSADRPFWASAGADANFDHGDDNMYSFQQ